MLTDKSKISKIKSKCLQRGWTLGADEVEALLDAWPDLNENEQEGAKKALVTSGLKACQKLLLLWDATSPTARGALARSLGRAILQGVDVSPSVGGHEELLHWMCLHIHKDDEPRVRKGLIQAAGAYCANHPSQVTKTTSAIFSALLLAADRENLQSPEAKALCDALAKSGRQEAKEALIRLQKIALTHKDESPAKPTKQDLILARNISRNNGPVEEIKVDLLQLLQNIPQDMRVLFRFVPGIERIVIQKRLFVASFEEHAVLEGGHIHGLLKQSSNRDATCTARGVLKNRLWKDMGLILGEMIIPSDSAQKSNRLNMNLAKTIASTVTTHASLLGASPIRPVRIRLGRQSKISRSHIWDFAARIAEANCGLVCDGRSASWDIILVSSTENRSLIVAMPQHTTDHRFDVLADQVEGASQQTIAAALVALASNKAPAGSLSVWDPFCGAGTEVFEYLEANFGDSHPQEKSPVSILGNDVSQDAITIAKARLKNGPHSTMASCSIEFSVQDALHMNRAFDVIVTNPPFGMRTARGEARGLLQSFFKNVTKRLNPGGCFVLLSHAPVSTKEWGLQAGLQFIDSFPVKLGRMPCEIQKFKR
jgi:SAM-dependent methyltransferase